MSTEEIWRLSPSLPEYMVSDLGRIMRIPYLKETPNGGLRQYGGKPWYGVDVGNRMTFRFQNRTFKVHRLVCEAFNGPPPEGKDVCMHIDEDYSNNKPSNLSWGTQKENLNAPGFIEYCKNREHPKSKTH